MTKNEPQQTIPKTSRGVKKYLFAVALIVGVGLWAYCRYSGTTIKKIVDTAAYEYVNYDADKRIKSLENDFSRLNKQIESIVACQNSEKRTNERNNLRRKWKIWIALRSKIESGESFDEELQNFRVAFDDDEEVVKLVEELTREADAAPTNNKLFKVCGKFLGNIVKFKKIDQRKLMEISGYVLSSISCKSSLE